MGTSRLSAMIVARWMLETECASTRRWVEVGSRWKLAEGVGVLMRATATGGEVRQQQREAMSADSTSAKIVRAVRAKRNAGEGEVYGVDE
jgi:hypothetical protein